MPGFLVLVLIKGVTGIDAWAVPSPYGTGLIHVIKLKDDDFIFCRPSMLHLSILLLLVVQLARLSMSILPYQ